MNKNKKLLDDFTKYCNANPDERFWQALRNWSEYSFIGVSNGGGSFRDTFYWENKTN